MVKSVLRYEVPKYKFWQQVARKTREASRKFRSYLQGSFGDYSREDDSRIIKEGLVHCRSLLGSSTYVHNFCKVLECSRLVLSILGRKLVENLHV